MIIRSLLRRLAGLPVLALALAALALTTLTGAAGIGLLTDGDFEACQTSGDLRRDNKGPDWSETRGDTAKGPKLLLLSTKKVADNVTHKALIKAHPDLNTYLTQKFAAPQLGTFTLAYDICVKEILPDDNHSAFCLVGASYDKKNGPNSTGKERFVFLGWENAKAPGKINLFAREGNQDWAGRTLVAENLDLMVWHHVEVAVDVKGGTYKVRVGQGAASKPLKAFKGGTALPKKLTHVSFASWNDGAGTFYVDNVKATNP
jgi:hypothetical protein